MVQVRLTDPLLYDDVHAYLAAALPVRVREERNALQVEFTDGPAALEEQIEAVKRVTNAWRAAGHVDVRAEVVAVRGGAQGPRR